MVAFCRSVFHAIRTLVSKAYGFIVSPIVNVWVMSHCKHTRVLFVVMCRNKIIERAPTTLFGRLVRYSALGANYGKTREAGSKATTVLLLYCLW